MVYASTIPPMLRIKRLPTSAACYGGVKTAPLVAVLCVLILAGLVAWFALIPDDQGLAQQADANPIEQPIDESSPSVAPLATVDSAAQAPVEDTAPTGDEPSSEAAEPAKPPAAVALAAITGHDETPAEGASQAIDPARHPQAQSTYDALVAGTHPERASSLIMPAPFDEAAFVADPESYLAISEPGRVWQPAQPGPDVPALQAFGPTRHRIGFGETASLMVRTLPNRPVSFTSFDLGTFQANGLPNITVQANELGYAGVTFVASGGAIADVSILCASPVASGQVPFTVIITEAQ